MTKDEKSKVASQCPICNRVVWDTDVADCVATHKQEEKPKDSEPQPVNE